MDSVGKVVPAAAVSWRRGIRYELFNQGEMDARHFVRINFPGSGSFWSATGYDIKVGAGDPQITAHGMRRLFDRP